MAHIPIVYWVSEGDSSWLDINTLSEVIGLKNGWFVAVTILLFVGYLMVRGNLVARSTVENQFNVLKETLDSEQESRELWQKSAVELLQTSDLDRANSRHMLAVVETTLKIVTDLQAARDTVVQETDRR